MAFQTCLRSIPGLHRQLFRGNFLPRPGLLHRPAEAEVTRIEADLLDEFVRGIYLTEFVKTPVLLQYEFLVLALVAASMELSLNCCNRPVIIKR